MINKLIVVSTTLEIRDFLENHCVLLSENIYDIKDTNHKLLVCGIGIANMAVRLSHFLSENKIQSALNIGFCGSFDNQNALGNLVNVAHDCFAELGIMNNNGIPEPFEKHINNADLLNHLNKFVEPENTFSNQQTDVIKVKGVTVSSCTNSHERADFFRNNFEAQTESMEGAAFFLTCNQWNVPCLQLRAISNHIPGRSPEQWNTKLAQKTISEFLELFIRS